MVKRGSTPHSGQGPLCQLTATENIWPLRPGFSRQLRRRWTWKFEKECQIAENCVWGWGNLYPNCFSNGK